MARIWAMVLAAACLALAGGVQAAGAAAPKADSGLANLQHIIVIFQENRSFDHYFGALPYAPGTPYHGPALHSRSSHGRTGAACAPGDHACVDGLSCKPTADGGLACANWNAHADGRKVHVFHAATRCIAPDVDHEWQGSHRDANFAHPDRTLRASPNDGFVMQNDVMAPDTHRTGPADGERAMAYYTQADIPFYYDVATRFAISDRYFASVLGPSDPNHAFHLTGSFFGHITDEEQRPPRGGYRPPQGTIYDLLSAAQVEWAESYQDIPEGIAYRGLSDPHFIKHADLLDRLKGTPGAKALPSVVWVNALKGFPKRGVNSDEHPSYDIQRGQAWVSELLNDLRHGPYWKDSVVLITYDEAGGFYDHVSPPPAPQGGKRTPDGLNPGDCLDDPRVPAAGRTGGGTVCARERKIGTTYDEILGICPQYDPAKPYPAACPNFDQLGFRVPLMVVSAFAKPGYVSHRVADHTSLLALIEKRFLTGPDGKTQHLTARDGHAWTLEDMFDFKRSPSLNAALAPPAPPPAQDCTPH